MDVYGTIWPFARAALILAVAWVAAKYLRTVLVRFLEGRLDPTFRAFLVSALQPAVLILALPAALESVGVSITSIIALLSTAGLAIALALRQSLSNVASGALILGTRPFRVGDDVTVAGVSGKVRRIRILTTEIDASDGRRINVTNDKILGAPMELHASEGRVRVEVVVRLPRTGLDGGTLEALRSAAERVPDATAGADAVVPLEFEGDHVRIAVHVWADQARAHEVRGALFIGLHRVLPSPIVP